MTMATRTRHSSSARKKKSEPLRFYETWTFLIIFCILLPILVRTFYYAPFHIPSGSMKPTLLTGDYIFVSKSAYGYSRYSFPLGMKLFEGRKYATAPKRGDIIVFRLPSDPKVDYIKRLVGLPGDRLQVKRGVLYINGTEVPRRRIDDFEEKDSDGETLAIPQYVETLPNGVAYRVLDQSPNGRLDNTPVYTVPKGHYFFMGDNRDNSQDSRVLSSVGYVPEENLVGRADLVFLSTDGSLWKLWEWPSTIRPDRFMKDIF